MKKALIYNAIPWFTLIASLVLGVFIVKMEDYNRYFLVALLLLLAIAIGYRNNFQKVPVGIARTLLGMVFIFSGFVKGVDPLGTQYQIIDYFAAYGTTWANPLALPLAILMISVEFIVGVALVLNIRIPFTAWLVVLMMLFFTTTTLLDATVFSDKISDCGCFGKAVKLSNWQTFYKNIILDIWVVILFFGRYRNRNTFSWSNEVIISVVVAILFISFQVNTLRHLPVIDFLDWKVGVKLNPPKTQPVTYSFLYENNETKKVQEFDSQSIPTDGKWTFVDTKIHDPNPRNLMIPIFSNRVGDGQEISEVVAEYPDYFFIVAIHNLKKTNHKHIPQILDLMDFAQDNDKEFVFLFDLNSTTEMIENFMQKIKRNDLHILYSDDKSIKSIVRSNPGLILLKNGVVVDKWAWRDIPTTETVQKLMN